MATPPAAGSPATSAIGGFPARVEPGTVNDPASKKTRRIDIAAFAVGDDGREAMLAIGEAKWHETMSFAHLERLRRIRGVLTAQGRPGAATARLLCFSRAGFTAELRDEAAQSGEVRLLTPADLYTGTLLPLAEIEAQPSTFLGHAPTVPSTPSRRKSACPLWRAYSRSTCTITIRSDTSSPHRG